MLACYRHSEPDPIWLGMQETDANSRKQVLSYDAANRQVAVAVYASAGDATPAKTTTLSYDLVNNLTGYDDGATSASYQYDLARQLTQASVDFGAFSGAGDTAQLIT